MFNDMWTGVEWGSVVPQLNNHDNSGRVDIHLQHLDNVIKVTTGTRYRDIMHSRPGMV